MLNFSASNWAMVSRELMSEWETTDCTARTATPTMRVNFYFHFLFQWKNIHFHFPPNNCNFHFQGWSSAKCDCDWRKENLHQISFIMNCLSCILNRLSYVVKLHQDLLTTKHKSFNPHWQILVSLSIIYSVSTILSTYYTQCACYSAQGTLIFKKNAA